MRASAPRIKGKSGSSPSWSRPGSTWSNWACRCATWRAHGSIHVTSWGGMGPSMGFARGSTGRPESWTASCPPALASAWTAAHSFPLVAGLVALKPVHPQVGVRRVASPLQPEASTYGSTFSRALEVRFPGSRRLHVSGTAAIDAAGRSMHHGDTAGQVRATLDVAPGLAGSGRDGPVRCVARAVCYFRNPGDIAPFLDSDEGQGAGVPAPSAATKTICRDDLLFEVEADALLSR